MPRAALRIAPTSCQSQSWPAKFLTQLINLVSADRFRNSQPENVPADAVSANAFEAGLSQQLFGNNDLNRRDWQFNELMVHRYPTKLASVIPDLSIISSAEHFIFHASVNLLQQVSNPVNSSINSRRQTSKSQPESTRRFEIQALQFFLRHRQANYQFRDPESQHGSSSTSRELETL